MDKQRARQLYELVDRLSKLDVNTLSEEQKQQRSTMIAKLQEEVKEGIVGADKEPGEYDQEGEMAKQDLTTAANAAEELHSILDSDENLPEWVQAKITKAVDYLDTVRDYMKSKDQDITEGNDHSLKKVWDRYSKHLAASRGDHSDVTQIHKSGEITRNIRKYVRDHHGQKAVDDMERYADRQGMAEGSQGVDSLVTDTLRIMKGPEFDDAELAIKTVLGDRAYNERRSYYSFFINQLVDMYGKPEGSKTVDSLVTNSLAVMRGPTRNDAIAALKTALGNAEYNSRSTFYKLWINQAVDKYRQQGVTEAKKPSPKLTAVNIKKTESVSEEINTEAYERLQKVFAFKNYES